MPPDWDDQIIQEHGFGEADFARIAAKLGVRAILTEDQVRRLQRAALVYYVMHQTDWKTEADDDSTPLRPGRSEIRRALMDVVEAAGRLNSAAPEMREWHKTKLRQALAAQPLLFTDLGQLTKDLDLSDPADIARLDELAESIADQIGTSHDPKLARWVLIRELAPIFESMAGRPAGRSVRMKKESHSHGFSSEEAGSFRRFACTVLEILNPADIRGVDADIKRRSWTLEERLRNRRLPKQRPQNP